MKQSKKNVAVNDGFFEYLRKFLFDSIVKHPFIVLAVACLFANACINLNPNFFENSAFYIFIIGIVLIFIAAIYLIVNEKLSTRNVILLIAVSSFLLHVMYICYTAYTVRQHDVGTIGWLGGHVGYVEYFLQHNFQLPNFNPLDAWQFYHPPVHHLIAAVWVKLNTLLGTNYNQAIESIQILTLFYSGCITIISYKIFKELNLKKLALIIPFAIVCFHPTLTILSGSINNDILCITLMMAAILWTIRWYKKPKMTVVIMIALLVGISMLVKTSGFLVAPGIAVVFLIKLIQEYKMWLKLSCQYLVFGLISIPVGMSWSIYELLRYDVAINHIPRLASNIPQALNDYSVFNRLFDFSPAFLQNIFEAFGTPYREHNIFIAILKNSVFGEFNLAEKNASNVVFAHILFYINALLVAVSIACMIYAVIKKSKTIDWGMKSFLMALYLGIFGFYIKFALDYTAIASMDYRYMAPTFILGSLFIGIAINNIQDDKTKSIKKSTKGIAIITAMFCLASVLVYTLLGIPV